MRSLLLAGVAGVLLLACAGSDASGGPSHVGTTVIGGSSSTVAAGTFSNGGTTSSSTRGSTGGTAVTGGNGSPGAGGTVGGAHATGGNAPSGGTAAISETAKGGSSNGGSAVGSGGNPSVGAGGSQLGVGGNSRSSVTGGRSGTGGQAPGGSAQSGGMTGTGGIAGNPWIRFDSCSIVSRSNVVLAHANSTATQLMPIGNGTLGAAVWAANGFTAQLNRADTMPNRLSPGWLTIPGLAKMTGAADFRGTLDLCNGMLIESGGGMTAKIYIRADSDELVVDVTGADPNVPQSATVSLWSTRNPTAAASGAIATLSESWTDTGSWASNQKFGTLAALTAGGRNVTASASGRSISVSVTPNIDGTFRIICGSPKFNGSTAAATVASQLIGSDASNANLGRTHTDWWHSFWARVGAMKISTSDGSGEYHENLRSIFLYAHASESRGERPGSQAGIADFYNFSQDTIDWYAAGYWFWNLRMQVAAAASSGAFDLNAPVFNLYTSNLANMQAWTKSQMGGRAGICVPETMRFNGNGYWYTGNHSCDELSSPNYNALTLSSGAEVGLWLWRQYLMTQDKDFLVRSFPFMLEAARFLHVYANAGSDGKLQMSPSNAHENQWATTNPMNDIAAMRAFFPAVVAAAQVVGSTDPIINELRADIPKLPELPRTNPARSAPTSPASDGTNIFAYSGQPTAAVHNSENDDLEPVWPYDLISDNDPTLFAVAKRTYGSRAFKDSLDWSLDAIQAARLGLASEVPARITANVSKYQVYPCGLAAWSTSKLNAPYIEQAGVITSAINEAVATDFDGTIRLAPALPSNWSVSGTVYIRGRSKVHVQFQNGSLAFGVLEAGSAGTFVVRNPWVGTQATVFDDSGMQVVAPTAGATLNIGAEQGHSYLIKRSSDAIPSLVQVTGSAATTVKKLGSRTIGIP